MCAESTCTILFKQSLFLLTHEKCTCVLPQTYILFVGVLISNCHAGGRQEIKDIKKIIEFFSKQNTLILLYTKFGNGH